LFFAEIVEEGTEDLFFEHGFGTNSQSLTERGLPRGNDGLRIHQNSSINLNIRFSAHAPGNGCVLTGKLIHDAKTRPIEIRMAAQFRSSLAKLRKKQMRRGCGLPIRADQRPATRANLSRSGADDTRILTNEDDPHGRIKRRKWVFASKLAIGEERRLTLPAMQIEDGIQCRVRCSPKIEHQWELWLRFRGVYIIAGITLLVDCWDIWQSESDCGLMLRGNLPPVEKGEERHAAKASATISRSISPPLLPNPEAARLALLT